VAAAAIQCGYAALVEARGRKAGSTTRWLDLWIQFGRKGRSDDPRTEECVELKVGNYYRDQGVKENPNNYLKDAVKDARKITTPCSAKIGACVFKAVYAEPPTEAALDLARQEIDAGCSPDAVGWAFPACVRSLKDDDGYVPGVILAMKLVRDAGVA
jgi:hypothetical protein